LLFNFFTSSDAKANGTSPSAATHPNGSASMSGLSDVSNTQAATEFRMKLAILSSALKAREAELITPAQTCQILSRLLQGDFNEAARMLDSFIMSYVSEYVDKHA